VACGTGATCTGVAFCDSGSRVVGGGFNFGSSTGAQVLVSQPFMSVMFGDGWLVHLRNNGASPITFTAWAVCILTVP
jgi:hypothetical protein